MTLRRFTEEMGISHVTCWRWRNNGWLHTFLIAGRHYVTREEIRKFQQRMASGEVAGEVQNPRDRKAEL